VLIVLYSYLGLGLMSGRFQVLGGEQTSDGMQTECVQFFTAVRPILKLSR